LPLDPDGDYATLAEALVTYDLTFLSPYMRKRAIQPPIIKKLRPIGKKKNPSCSSPTGSNSDSCSWVSGQLQPDASTDTSLGDPAVELGALPSVSAGAGASLNTSTTGGTAVEQPTTSAAGTPGASSYNTVTVFGQTRAVGLVLALGTARAETPTQHAGHAPNKPPGSTAQASTAGYQAHPPARPARVAAPTTGSGSATGPPRTQSGDEGDCPASAVWTNLNGPDRGRISALRPVD
jgi:hypothetical protein